MSRRWVAFGVVGVSLLPALPHASAAGAKNAELPRTNCATRLFDADGDAKFGAQSTDLSAAKATSPGTDITGLNLRVTADELQVFLKIKDIPTVTAMPQTDMAYIYAVKFKYDAKTFDFQHEIVNSLYNPSGLPADPAPLPSDEKQYPKGNTGNTGADTLPGFEADINPTSEFVVFTAPRPRVEQNIAATLTEGATFTALSATTTMWVGGTKYESDKTDVAAEDAVWSVGDDRCFGPPPATLADLTAPAVQFGDAVTLSAVLTKEDGSTAIADKPVQFAVGTSAPLTGTTNADGVASVSYVAALPAGTHDVTVSWAGDATDGKTKETVPLVIKSEVTKFAALKVTKPSATSRVVTATLLDDDGKAVSGQKVDWYVNGKKVGTVVTDAGGRAVYRGAKPTQLVQAKFAGLAGKYLASMSAKAKV